MAFSLNKLEISLVCYETSIQALPDGRFLVTTDPDRTYSSSEIYDDVDDLDEDAVNLLSVIKHKTDTIGLRYGTWRPLSPSSSFLPGRTPGMSVADELRLAEEQLEAAQARATNELEATRAETAELQRRTAVLNRSNGRAMPVAEFAALTAVSAVRHRRR